MGLKLPLRRFHIAFCTSDQQRRRLDARVADAAAARSVDAKRDARVSEIAGLVADVSAVAITRYRT